ncbi:hypothetical protein ElyMa_004505700 [Elysia marginata]|uniref:Uncharacterized protein n=1 Tax=Elysia marginata TaxID=1093978 RepID=A0AAV4HMK3_9GAST|nr:hypothetical protein ElyMa_004505700 [Elysia marginata]
MASRIGSLDLWLAASIMKNQLDRELAPPAGRSGSLRMSKMAETYARPRFCSPHYLESLKYGSGLVRRGGNLDISNRK